jgi:drug/metabolite transporter (DMT)-like permease
MNSVRLKAFFYLFLATAIWGFAAIVIKQTLLAIPPLIFLLYRFFISSVFGLFMMGKPKKQPKFKPVIVIEILTFSLLSSTVSLSLLFLGLSRTSVLTLSLISLCAPLFLLAAATISLKEKITHREKIGAAIAITGTALITVYPAVQSSHGTGELSGNILIILSTIADSIAIILLKRLSKKGIQPLLLTNISFIIGFLTILPITLLFHPIGGITRQLITLPLNYHLGVLYMAIFSGTFAYYFRAKGQKTVKVGEAGLFAYLQSVITVFFATAILREQMTPLFLLGAAIIVFGIILAETHHPTRL